MANRVQYRRKGNRFQRFQMPAVPLKALLMAGYYGGLAAGGFLLFNPPFYSIFSACGKQYLSTVCTGGVLSGLSTLLWTALFPIALGVFLAFCALAGPVYPVLLFMWGIWGGLWCAYLLTIGGLTGVIAYIAVLWLGICTCAGAQIQFYAKAAGHSSNLWHMWMGNSDKEAGGEDVNAYAFTRLKTGDLLREAGVSAAICFAVCLLQLFCARVFHGAFAALL